MSGPCPLRIDRQVEVPFGFDRLVVVRGEGLVELRLCSAGWPVPPHDRCHWNHLADAESAQALRRAADAIEALLAGSGA